MKEDKPKEILELERALGIDHVDYYYWDGEKVTKMKINNKGLKDISPLIKFQNLEELDLTDNQISDLAPLSKITSLKNLYLGVNKINNLTPISNTISLTNLELWGNQIKDISPLSSLVSLNDLDLKFNQISDISPISAITKLQYLALNGNQINNIESISGLKWLNVLRLSENLISDITPISELLDLNDLELFNNKISDISPLTKLKALNKLILSNNQIVDISSLIYLTELQILYLLGNQITDVLPLSFLDNIDYLDLRNNKIGDLSPLKKFIVEGFEILLNRANVTRYLSKREILVGENPLENPPISIIEQGSEAVLEYFARVKNEKKKGTRPINEAKLIIIGEPRSGKTTLMDFLLGKPFKDNESTQGFKIEQWKLKENTTDYRINIWDFGGQDIQSTVHQFFLTQDTLYLLLLNASTDELPDKYIEQIKSYAPDSPIIIIANKIEVSQSFEMGIKRLKETHKDKQGNTLIKGVFKVSLLKGHKEVDPSYFPILEEMKQVIQKTLLEMPHIHRSVPITYLDVKEYLESAFFEDKPYISHDTYEQICREKGLNIESDDDLLGYLNNLGTVRYFDDLSLRNLQILNPEWLSDGVYRILVDGRTKQLRGIITERDFDTILQKTEENQFEYPKKHYNYLIQMIRKFDMGYYDEDTKRIFIPRAFGLDYVQNFDSTLYKNEAIHFFFRYESFIPSTIMPAFISRMFGLVKDQLYSQNGVVLEQNGQFALVEQTTIKNRIDIWVSGDKSKGEYFEFFLEIRKVFREFHEKRPGLVVDEMIGLGKNSDVSVKYKQLIANKINNVNDYIGEDGKPYNIDELLGRFESKNNTVQYITEQNNYHVGGDMYSGQIYLLKHHSSELLELLKQNKANFSEEKHEEIDRMISELEKVETVPTDKTASKGFLQQLNETRKNIGKIMSEEGVKWFTKSALDGKFNETIMNAANKVMQGLQNPMLRDFVDNGSNMM